MDGAIKGLLWMLLLGVVCSACQNSDPKERKGAEEEINHQRTSNDNIRKERTPLPHGPDKLSDYGLFHGELSSQLPAENVVAYDINVPLFSDYAGKDRFIYVPAGQKITMGDGDELIFPTGTRLVKTFHYPAENEAGRKLLETRILEKTSAGDDWKALTYIWNDEQTEAFLEVAGGNIDVSWRQEGTLRKVDYSVPNVNQCKTCHGRARKIKPLGPKVAQLNKPYTEDHGPVNQLVRWQQSGILELDSSPAGLAAFPLWGSAGKAEQLARAYLDSNCGSCHHPEGSANTSGLFLTYDVADNGKLGIMKRPVAAGKGSGGRLYSIYPGRPDESILLYRMESTDAGVMMPELGRSLVHAEGVALVRQWILEMARADSD